MRFATPAHKKLVYESIIPIRWGDMDAMGHVNNTIYFRYMETSRIDWCRSIGCMPEQSKQGPVIVNAYCSFIKQLRYPGDVRVKHHVTTVGQDQLRHLHHDGARPTTPASSGPRAARAWCGWISPSNQSDAAARRGCAREIVLNCC